MERKCDKRGFRSHPPSNILVVLPDTTILAHGGGRGALDGRVAFSDFLRDLAVPAFCAFVSDVMQVFPLIKITVAMDLEFFWDRKGGE